MVSGTCQQCGVGKFSVCTGPNSNTCKCQDCAAGQYSTDTSCLSCGVGTYSDASTLFQCNSCAPHHHALTTGARECTRCPYGKLNANPSTQNACAICEFGEYLHNNVCKPCGFVHDRYCADLKEYTVSYGMDATNVIDWTQCAAFVQTKTTVETCATCTCNFVRNSISYDSSLECVGKNEYVSLETFQCEYCPDAYFIVDQVCVPYASHHFSRDMYNNCIPGYVKNKQIGASGTCVQCAVGTFSNSPQDTACSVCPRNLVTMHPGSFSENDCAYCPRNHFMVFDENTRHYRCDRCDPCTTRREAAHMQQSCHRCQLQDMIEMLRLPGDSSETNCVLSEMGDCDTYFDTDDVFQTCRQKCSGDNSATVCNFCHRDTTSDLEGTTFPGIQIHPKIFIPGLFTPTTYINGGGIQNEDRIMIFMYDILKDDNIAPVGERHRWLEFSNLVNQDFAALRVANYAICVQDVFPIIMNDCFDECSLGEYHDQCSRLSTEHTTDSAMVFTNDARFVSGSQRYFAIFSKYYNYYTQLYEQLKPLVRAPLQIVGPDECIFNVGQRFSRVSVLVSVRDMPVSLLETITIYDSSDGMIRVDFPHDNTQHILHIASVDVDSLNDICSVKFSMPPDMLKTHNQLYIDFTISDTTDPLDVVPLLSATSVLQRPQASNTTFFMCPEETFVHSPAYITDNRQYDELQNLVRPHMCRGKDYSISS